MRRRPSHLKSAIPSATHHGRSFVVNISSDITREQFLGWHDGLDYRGVYDGPSPAATTQELLWQHAATDTQVLPPMADLFPNLDQDWPLAVGILREFLAAHRFPPVLWTEDAEVGFLFLNNALCSLSEIER